MGTLTNPQGVIQHTPSLQEGAAHPTTAQQGLWGSLLLAAQQQLHHRKTRAQQQGLNSSSKCWSTAWMLSRHQI